MRNDKHIAVKLRRQGKSYKYIEKELEISRGTLSEWFSQLAWSRTIKLDLERRANFVARKRLRKVNKERQVMWEAWREEAREKARKEFSALLKNPLFIAGIMLYWGEGDSKIANGNVRLSNTSPDMIRLFAQFLLKICHVPRERLRGFMILYPDLDAEKCQKFWSLASRIPVSQFTKTQFIRGYHPTKRLSCGIFQISYNSRQLKEKIFVWIDLFQKQFPA